MVNITKLYCGEEQPADGLRYGHGHGAPKSAAERRPIVVWNVTRTCNLRCVHCYSDSYAQKYPGELTHEEAKRVIDDLVAFKVPAVLFSGGEPLARPDLLELMEYAATSGLRVTLSTNGTLIDEPTAQWLREIGLTYVGVSFDGMGETNDLFRGKKGAFDAALRGMRNCARWARKSVCDSRSPAATAWTCTTFLISSKPKASSALAFTTLSIQAAAMQRTNCRRRRFATRWTSFWNAP